ncbi:hypothetical protein FRC10_000178 [Ceratobasidium sp. 414]|nr:hypothetical protein FRC10_000178 [Ceratobasidium sp. 414]
MSNFLGLPGAGGMVYKMEVFSSSDLTPPLAGYEVVCGWRVVGVGTEGAIPGSSLGGGNMFPGVALPFGQVKLGIDTSVLNLDQGGISSANSGYTPRGNATGFTLLHTSGTGGQPKYGVVSQMPLLGSLEDQHINVADNRTYLTNRTEEIAQVGYFRTTFVTSGITTELTASRHAGILHYKFPPSTNGTAHILIDLAHALPSAGGGASSPSTPQAMDITAALGTTLGGIRAKRGKYASTLVVSTGLNLTGHVDFCGNFSTPATRARTFWTPYNHLAPPSASPTLSPYYEIYASDNLAIGGLLSWEYGASQGLEIESRVGVSFISAEKACQFVEDEVPWSQSFNATVQAAKDAWNTEILSSITVPAENGATNETLLGLLYTHLYGTALMPTDRTGENPGKWNSQEPYYDDWYTPVLQMWDSELLTENSFAALLLSTTLFTLTDMSKFTLDLGQFQAFRWLSTRWKEDTGHRAENDLWCSGNQNGRTQGGSDADNVLADAYIKGLDKVQSINWKDAYKAVQKDADVTPRRNIDFNAFDGGTKEGRNALPDWVSLGYITTAYSRSISKGVEYAQNDFAAYLLAKSLGDKEDAERYLKRANFNIPHDTAALIKLMGGPEAFERRLDASFVDGFGTGAGPANTAGTALFNPGNEPSFQTPFLYNYINGKQYKTVEKTRYIITLSLGLESRETKVCFTNEIACVFVEADLDAGAMATWLLWNLLGVYPVTSQPLYLVSAPFFRAVDVRLGTSTPTSPSYKSRTYLRIRAPNLDATNIYVQGVKVNGKSIDRSFILHSEIINGGTIEFAMGPNAIAWDSGLLPPSLSTGWTMP